MNTVAPEKADYIFPMTPDFLRDVNMLVLFMRFFLFKDDVFSLLSPLKAQFGCDEPEPHCCGLFPLMIATAPALSPRTSPTRSIHLGTARWMIEGILPCAHPDANPAVWVGSKKQGGKYKSAVNSAGDRACGFTQAAEPGACALELSGCQSLSLSCYCIAPYSSVVLQSWALYKHVKI